VETHNWLINVETKPKGKETIFISHSTPEDNMFTLWLSSRLSLLGYSVWIDLKNLGGGDDSWGKIEKLIREETIKFIFVVSHHSIKKQGTLKELALADRLRIDNFIIPVNIDNVLPSEFPAEIVRKNCLNFLTSWRDGFVELLDTLEKENVKKKSAPDQNTINLLTGSLNVNSNRLIKNKHENYQSNWFELKLPKDIYIYQKDNIDAINLYNFPYQYIFENGYLISLACPDCVREVLNFNNLATVEISKLIINREFNLASWNIQIKETSNKVIELLNNQFAKFMLNKGLAKYELANGECYFIPWKLSDESQYPKVNLKKYGRRSIQLVGKNLNLNWHFAIEGNAFFFPTMAFGINYHVIFTDNGSLVEKIKQHSRRRSVSRTWYNKKWRDLLLGLMLWLSDEGSEIIKIPVCKHFLLELKNTPVLFNSYVGYVEPKKKSGQFENE
jgi:hypothetical protein